MELLAKNKVRTVGLIAAAVLIVIILASTSRERELSPVANPCAQEAPERRHGCYLDYFRELGRRKGIEAALHFVFTAARETENPVFTHILLHPIGQEVYRSTRDLEQARSYLFQYYERYRSDLPPNTLGTDIALEGYHHGVLQAYFAEHESTPKAELMRESCADTINLERPADPIVRKSSSRCFHALGHALMYANRNHLWRSLADCGLLPQAWTRGYCYYGAFMEYHYRSNPAFTIHLAPHADSPEPPPGPLEPICEQAAPHYRQACHRLIGRDEVARSRDYARAFKACQALDAKERGPCIIETAFGLVSFGDEFGKMLAVCQQAGSEYERQCIIGAAVGVNSKPERKMLDRFCAVVHDEFRDDCFSAEISYAALDFKP